MVIIDWLSAGRLWDVRFYTLSTMYSMLEFVSCSLQSEEHIPYLSPSSLVAASAHYGLALDSSLRCPPFSSHPPFSPCSLALGAPPPPQLA